MECHATIRLLEGLPVNWLHDGTGSTTGHQPLPAAPAKLDTATSVQSRIGTGRRRRKTQRSVRDGLTTTHSLYAWVKRYGVPEEERKAVDVQADEMRRLKAELKRVTEERDILKKAAVYFAKTSA